MKYTMSRFEVIDNFLKEKEWLAQFNTVYSKDFLWSFGRRNIRLTENNNNANLEQYWANHFKGVLFQHWFHGEEETNFDSNFISPSQQINTKQPYYDIMIKPILDKFDVKRVLNARTNLYTWWHETDNTAGTHIDHDIEQDYLTLIYNISESDGGTYIEGHGKIDKVKNRLIILDGKKPHRAIYQTNSKAQVSTNINIIV